MRLFQNAGIYPAYLSRLNRLAANAKTFHERKNAFLEDRYGACHFLQPILSQDASAFFTNGDDEALQRFWAIEQGLPSETTLEAILLAQIEHHGAEVFYNMDPMRYGSDFVRKLPGCVKKTVAWRAAPSPGADFSAYDLVVCNFPGIIEGYRQRGWHAAYFAPAHDPEMDTYASNTDRPVDVLFVGGYSRHHRTRALVLEAVAKLRNQINVMFCLDRSRLTRLAESPLGYVLPLSSHRRPLDIRAVSAAPVFGRELYATLSKAKIVLNGAVDMAGPDRGNMRCFEAMGCGALMVSDQGNYPAGMDDGKSMLLYGGAEEARRSIERALVDYASARAIAMNGYQVARTHYSKSSQWKTFTELVGAV
jgi:hypothetical protein